MKLNKFLTRFIIFLCLLCLTGLIIFWWWKEGLVAVNNKNQAPVIFVVQKGEGVRSIASNLQRQNLIRSSTAFFLLVKLMGIETNLQAGDFRLNQSMDGKEIALELTHGYLDIWVTSLEGWRVEEIAMRLAKDISLPESQFLQFAEEGYMFPDTYLIPRDASAAAIVDIFRNNFEKKVSAEMRAEMAKQKLSLKDAVILASIVEREGRSSTDRPIIAGVLRNRLDHDWPLQADATLQYALGYQPSEKTWWKKSLTEADKKIKSPFNTYLYPGLPPAPLANPGLESLKAVIYPQASDYWFYLHDQEGAVHFAKTIEEHNANINNYLR